MDGKLIATFVLCALAITSISLIFLESKTRVTVSVPMPTKDCTCGSQKPQMTKYLIFWKDNGGQKSGAILYPSLEAASAAIPRDAEEARITPVKIDAN
jgi:hypothetical protein